ncbi:MAG: type V CRISPR-associated endonuclease Cas1 [Erysipelotrichaceae bacterium]|nr:type V CRISPR-associated endonuclease Cas1 [Erysipelotrichaceae bacterium]
MEKQIIIYSPMKGDKLSFRNDNAIISDKEGKTVFQCTCYRLFAIMIIGHVSITSGLMQRARKFEFSIVLMTTTLRPYCVINPFAESNYLLREKQYEYADIGAAKTLIKNKMENQSSLIKTKRDKTEYDKGAINIINDCISLIPSASNIAEIMSIEGRASKVYFKSWFDNVAWKGRKPRIKYDYVNSLLDIGYTMLFSYIDGVAALFGFDRYKGILHTQFYMRKSLICDLIEPFRVIIDNQVKKGINLGQFKECDFYKWSGQYFLEKKKNAAYSEIFVKVITEYREDIYLYVRDYYRKTMKGELDEKMPEWKYK